tara:strand:- start:431 stop:592 length:162 start_codon:yes stop_codon:yes gene_type:complete
MDLEINKLKYPLWSCSKAIERHLESQDISSYDEERVLSFFCKPGISSSKGNLC